MRPESFPIDLGFYMPAEWEPHAATWLTWPHNQETWPGQNMEDIETVYIQMIRALAKGETVNILANNSQDSLFLRETLRNNSLSIENIKIFITPTNDSWIRDYGPNFIVRDETKGRREVAANLWNFNSWGGKYEWELDNRAGAAIMEALGLPAFSPGIVLEGGAIEVNGAGLCLTTEQCLLNPNRNGGMGREEMESYLKRCLGVRQIIWCQGDLEGDDTDGHIDNLVRFVNPDTVLYAWEEDPSDPNHACLNENLKILKSFRDAKGQSLNVIPLPMPGRIDAEEGRMPASYANFYIGNRAILLPTYNHPNDEIAATLLGKCFPSREIACIPCETFILGLGAVHCVTQQEPSGEI